MKKRGKRVGKQMFFIVAISIFFLTYAAFFGISNYYGDNRLVYIKGASDIRWGIDISGGVEAIFKPDIAANKITSQNMEAAKEIIETRLVNQNINDSEVYIDNKNKQVIVRFPWKSGEKDFDPAAAVEELGKTAMLKFCEGSTSDTVILQGSKDVKSASPGYDSEKKGYVVQLELTADGSAKFAEATSRLKGKTISIWMDETQLSNPTVDDVITNGRAIISGNFDENSVKALANKINAGSLPFALNVDNSKLQIISPTLGAQALQVMTYAGIAAFILVCLMMIFKYRLSGVIAVIALTGQVMGMIACASGFFAGFPSSTMTIPGIAGIILSIGMGVDANVIASERVKEEFYNGKTVDGSIEAGYDNSFSAVLDGNVTVFIVSCVLMGAFGAPDSFMAKIFSPVMRLFSTSVTGVIYSFGFTLLIGVIFNMIMGVYASRTMLKSISRFKFFRKPWLYGGAKNV